MQIAVILLNYNSSSDCKKCLSFLQKQDGVELDVIIVDNASRNEDKEELRKLESWRVGRAPLNLPKGETLKLGKVGESLGAIRNITLIEAEENRGYNAGNNLGLHYAAEKGYKYALIANPDMEFPDPLYIKKLIPPLAPTGGRLNTEAEYVPSLNEEGWGGATVIVASDIVTPEGIHQNPMLPEGDWKSSFGWIKGFFKKPKKGEAYDFIGDFKNSGYCSKVSGCALMVDLNFIKEIGFFDEYPFLYCEEAILAKQVERKGRKMYYTSDTQAIHRHVKSEKGDPRPRFRQWNRSRQYFIRKYSDDPWYGKIIASLSMSLYTSVLILGASIRSKGNRGV